ncbi:MAG: hypothetical protein AAF587_44890, partial [Bacteroidota bacterium]
MQVETFGPYGSFLGRYGKGRNPPSKNFNIPEGLDYVTVEFLFYEIDQWESTDEAIVVVGTKQLPMGEFSVQETDANRAKVYESEGIEFSRTAQGPASNIGFSSRKDQVHNVTLKVPSSYYKSSNSLPIGFIFNLKDELENESAGIDQLKITGHKYCAPGPVPTPGPVAPGRTERPSNGTTTLPPYQPTAIPSSNPPSTNI